MARKKRNRDGAYDKGFPVRLRLLIAEKRVSQAEVADLLDVSRQAVSRYCDGSSGPDWETIVQLARYFDVSVDYLLGVSAIKSTEIETKQICQTTGLSEDALHGIELIKEISSVRIDQSDEAQNEIIDRLKNEGFSEPYAYSEGMMTPINVLNAILSENKSDLCNALQDLSIGINFIAHKNRNVRSISDVKEILSNIPSPDEYIFMPWHITGRMIVSRGLLTLSDMINKICEGNALEIIGRETVEDIDPEMIKKICRATVEYFNEREANICDEEKDH